LNKNKANTLRGWTLGLTLAAIMAGFLIANINAFEISLIYLVLFLIVVGTGLVTNPWGGLTASGIAVFALVLVNQYVGIYPVQNRVVNIASELVVFLMAGPLAGWFSEVIEKHQAEITHWVAVAEERSAHEAMFNTLKPEWSRIRLEEEVARAQAYARPLSVAILQFTEVVINDRNDRVAALQALIRIARSTTATPAVVSYLGQNRVLLILPEHSDAQARAVMAAIQARAETEIFFPKGSEALGQPLRQFGKIQMAVASLGSGNGRAESLLRVASAGLSS
jgi:hypothetical protein